MSRRLVTTRAGQPSAPRRRVVVAVLVAALLLLLGMMLALGALLSRIEPGRTLERIDGGAPHWLAARRTGALDAVSAAVAELGNTGVVIVVAAVVGIVAVIVRRQWRPLVVLAVALAGETAIFLTTSAVIDRPRPHVEHLDADLPPTSSFPSGHTAAAVCLYGTIAALLLTSPRTRLRRTVVTLAVAVVVLVALARLYRGAHYPTDVLGSLLFALPWVLVVVRLLAPPGQPRPGAPANEP